MKDWCKIFIHEEHGQVVVLNTSNDENDAVLNVSWYPNWEHTGLMVVDTIFDNEDECDAIFEIIEEAEIIEMVDETVSDIRRTFADPEPDPKREPPKLRLV